MPKRRSHIRGRPRATADRRRPAARRHDGPPAGQFVAAVVAGDGFLSVQTAQGHLGLRPAHSGFSAL